MTLFKTRKSAMSAAKNHVNPGEQAKVEVSNYYGIAGPFLVVIVYSGNNFVKYL